MESARQDLPPSLEHTNVPRVPVAQITLSFGTLMPRNEMRVSLGIICQCALFCARTATCMASKIASVFDLSNMKRCSHCQASLKSLTTQCCKRNCGLFSKDELGYQFPCNRR